MKSVEQQTDIYKKDKMAKPKQSTKGTKYFWILCLTLVNLATLEHTFPLHSTCIFLRTQSMIDHNHKLCTRWKKQLIWLESCPLAGNNIVNCAEGSFWMSTYSWNAQVLSNKLTNS